MRSSESKIQNLKFKGRIVEETQNSFEYSKNILSAVLDEREHRLRTRGTEIK